MITHRAAKARAIAKRLSDMSDAVAKQLTAQHQTQNVEVRDLFADTMAQFADIVLSLCEDAEPYEIDR